jgi:hypothetical protein
MLSPAVPLTVSNFSVQLTTAPAGITFVVDLILSTGVIVTECTVAAGATSCSAASGINAIPANTAFSLGVVNDTAASWSGDVLFGYQVSG